MDKYEDVVIDNMLFYPTGFNIQWSSDTLGFGEISVYMQDDQIMIDSESMSREFVKALFIKVADKATL